MRAETSALSDQTHHSPLDWSSQTSFPEHLSPWSACSVHQLGSQRKLTLKPSSPELCRLRLPDPSDIVAILSPLGMLLRSPLESLSQLSSARGTEVCDDERSLLIDEEVEAYDWEE